jgi:hypothetical protein
LFVRTLLRLSLQNHQPTVWLRLLRKLCASSDLEICRQQAQQRLAAHSAGTHSVTSARRHQMHWQSHDVNFWNCSSSNVQVSYVTSNLSTAANHRGMMQQGSYAALSNRCCTLCLQACQAA